MKIICINEVEGLTVGKQYDVIKTEQVKFPWNLVYFVINDYNLMERYERSPMGIIEVMELTNIFKEYVGPEHRGLTIGKTYQILDDRCGYYYFLNDNNKFVGITKINYFGGKDMFKVADKTQINLNELSNL